MGCCTKSCLVSRPSAAHPDAIKYGENIDNDLFMMHRFCWCEEEACPWCREDEPAPHFHYKPTDFKVWWYKYIGRDMKTNRPATRRELADMFCDCLKALDEYKPEPAEAVTDQKLSDFAELIRRS